MRRGGRSRLWATGAALLIVLAGAPVIAAGAATFETGACPDKPEPIPALKSARCGVLVVPENRGKPDGRMIRLPVAILPSLSEPPAADPLVYMEGGPGGAALPTTQLLLDAGLNRARDVIVMGQRGTRYAEPALMCPEIDQFHTRLAALPYDDAATGQLSVEAARACRARLAGAGIELSAYNTTESAADFADLRVALNIAAWNVYGVSYGTDLALTYMREHPQGIRSVTIDSVVPPHLASAGLNWTNAGAGSLSAMAWRPQEVDLPGARGSRRSGNWMTPGSHRSICCIRNRNGSHARSPERDAPRDDRRRRYGREHSNRGTPTARVRSS
jgi:pimeloyl-ACP methyl ester carboxylesterase